MLNLKWSLQLLFLWEHTTIKSVLPLNLRGHIKGHSILILKIVDFVLPGAQSVPMQENLNLNSGVHTSPQVRNEAPQMLHCFTGIPHLQLCREILVPKSQYLVIMSTAFL